MRQDRTERLIAGLRVRPIAERHSQTLQDIAAASNQRQGKAAAYWIRWAAGLAIAAGLVVAAAYLAVASRPAGRAGLQPVRQGTSQPIMAEIVTVRSLEKAFSRGGLDEIERQLDRAFELVGPWLTALAQQDLL
jgi:hypothetical protein